MMDVVRGLFGIVALLGIGWLCSENRRSVAWRVIWVGLGIQLVVGVVIFHLPWGRQFFLMVNDGVLGLLSQAQRGAEFVFGPLAKPPGAEGSLGFVLAFQALPTAIFFAALTALLYHVGLLSRLVRLFARLFQRSLRVSGIEAVVASSNLFVGIESALTIRPYLATARRHELAVILTAGMATIASTVLGIYVAALAPVFPTIAGHLLTANFLSAPAAIIFARLLVPRDGGAEGAEGAEVTFERKGNWVQSLVDGAMEGFKLACGIAAVLIAFVGLLALVNVVVGGVAGRLGAPGFQIQTFLGWVFAPLAWVMGVAWDESARVGELLGLRLVATEVPAYFQLAGWMGGDEPLSARSMVIAVYALCGFAHVPSLGIFVGGLTALAPERATEIGSVALRCLIAATLACLLTGTIAGLVCGANPTSILAK
ncbi:MAG: nucleoside transporter C-terminal domain-containing protein [Chthoniobacterales bacterium]